MGWRVWVQVFASMILIAGSLCFAFDFDFFGDLPKMQKMRDANVTLEKEKYLFLDVPGANFQRESGEKVVPNPALADVMIDLIRRNLKQKSLIADASQAVGVMRSPNVGENPRPADFSFHDQLISKDIISLIVLARNPKESNKLVRVGEAGDIEGWMENARIHMTNQIVGMMLTVGFFLQLLVGINRRP
jgi:hypothetical protein